MKCFVSGCKNYWNKARNTEKLTFHRFPKASYKKWLKCLRLDQNIPYSKNIRICSIHFTPESFIKSGVLVRLKKNSFPTVALKSSSTSTHTEELMDIEENQSNSESTITPASPERSIISISSPRRSIIPISSPFKRRFLDRSSFGSASTSTSNSSGKRRKVELIKKFHNYSANINTVENKVVQLKKRCKKFQTKYHNSKKTIKNLKRKVQSLHVVVNDLTKKQLISTSASEHLKTSFSGVPRQIMARLLKNREGNLLTRSKFPKELQDFAMTLMFYSRKAYNYVRKTFDFCLPHPSSIRKIYSGVECAPGFTGSSFELLKIKADNYKKSNKELICSMIIDEMYIKKQIVMHNQKCYGYINIGNQTIDDETAPATQVFVILVVCLTEPWKLPIGYFLINTLTGAEKANLVLESIMRLDASGIKISSVTCDGPTANIAMLRKLGCVIDNAINDKPYFLHPNDGNDKIYGILDACHMLKLMRNLLAEVKQFLDNKGDLVEWRYIELLYKLQQEETLSLGNKLRKHHMEWQKQKMKVKLAAQTLSSSVAHALEFLKDDLCHPDFQGAGPTINFIKIIDRAFDLLNSRSPFGTGYKQTMRKTNSHVWRTFIEDTIEYLSGCTFCNGRSILKSPKKTPFMGFIISLKSVMGLFQQFVETDRLRYLLTYKYSQDHLELFFCSIRTCNGWNNNPNAFQFQHIYRRLLFQAQVRGVGGNCEAIDSTTILSLPSNQKSKNLNTDNTYNIDYSIARKFDFDVQTVEDHDYTMNYSPSLSELSENVVTYISGYVIRMVTKKIKCLDCLNAIQDFSKSCDTSDYKFLQRRDKGGLLWPTEGLKTICLKCEVHVRRIMVITNNKVPKESTLIKNLAISISQMFYDKNIFPILSNHYLDYEFSSNHVFLLIRTICECYLSLRFFNLIQKQNEVLEGTRVRQELSKLILFKNQ